MVTQEEQTKGGKGDRGNLGKGAKGQNGIEGLTRIRGLQCPSGLNNLLILTSINLF